MQYYINNQHHLSKPGFAFKKNRQLSHLKNKTKKAGITFQKTGITFQNDPRKREKSNILKAWEFLKMCLEAKKG